MSLSTQRNWITQENFEELRAWCARMDMIGPTPRLIVDESIFAGWKCFEEPDGPVVRMAPFTARRLYRWVDEQGRYLP